MLTVFGFGFAICLQFLQAHLTQAWLAVSDEPSAKVPGGYFYTCVLSHPAHKRGRLSFRNVSSRSALSCRAFHSPLEREITGSAVSPIGTYITNQGLRSLRPGVEMRRRTPALQSRAVPVESFGTRSRRTADNSCSTRDLWNIPRVGPMLIASDVTSPVPTPDDSGEQLGESNAP